MAGAAGHPLDSRLTLSPGPGRLRAPETALLTLGFTVPVGAVLPALPLGWLVGSVAVIVVVVLGVRRRRGFFPPAFVALLGLGSGMLAQELGLPDASALRATATRAEGAPISLRGRVVERPWRWGEGESLVLDVAPPAGPGRVRLEAPPGLPAAVGTWVEVTAILIPPLGPDAPLFRLRARAARRGVEVEGAYLGGLPEPPSPSPARDATRASAGLGALSYTDGLALSGLAALLSWLMGRRALVAGLPIVLVAALRGDPALLRILGPALALAAQLGRPMASDPRVPFSGAVIAVSLLDPASLGDLRYQLAFAGSLALAGPIRRALERGGLSTLLAPGFLVLGTLPLIARQTAHVSLASVGAGLVALPLSLVLEAPLRLLGVEGPEALRWPLDALAAALSSLGPRPLPTPSVRACTLAYAALAPLLAPSPTTRTWGLGGLSTLALVVLMLSPSWRANAPATVLALPRDGLVLALRGDAETWLFTPGLEVPRRVRLEPALALLRLGRATRVDHLICAPGGDCAATARVVAAELEVGSVVTTTSAWSTELGDPAARLEVSTATVSTRALRLRPGSSPHEMHAWRHDGAAWQSVEPRAVLSRVR